MTVRELLARIDSHELTEWAAYFNLEPWGTETDDWRAGMVASTIANVNRDSKRQRKPFVPQDFMPTRAVSEKEEQSPDAQAEVMASWGRVWEEKYGGDS